MIVILNNGTRIAIGKEAVQSISQGILSGDIKQWRIQIDASSNDIISIFNLKDVSAICREEDIVDGLE